MARQQQVDPSGTSQDAGVEVEATGRGPRGRLAALIGLAGLAFAGGGAAARRKSRTAPARASRVQARVLRTRRVETTVTLRQGTNDGLVVTCPRAMAAIGSGFSLAAGAAADVHLMSSLPADVESSRSWVFGFRNLLGRRVSATLYVVCTPVRR